MTLVDDFTIDYDNNLDGEEKTIPEYKSGKKSNESVSHWEFCINIEEKSKFKPIGYSVVDIEELMRQCGNQNLNIREVLYSFVRLKP